MVGFGVRGRLRKGRLGVLAVGTYRLVRTVLVEGLQRSGRHEVSDAEVLGWWSVVHGLAFLAIDGHLRGSGRSTKGVEAGVRDVQVLAALDARRRQGVAKASSPAGVQPAPPSMAFVSRYSSMPSTPHSRPLPDCL